MAGAAPRSGRSQQPDLPGTRPMPRSPKPASPKSTKPRAPGAAKPSGTKPGRGRASAAFEHSMGRWSGLPPTARRAISIGTILAVLFIGFPVTQALFGEFGAMLILCLVAGFALGRATAPRR